MRLTADSARRINPTTQLTNRQRACLLRVAEGRTSKEIARELAISPSTVNNHVTAALRSLGCANRFDAARFLREASAAQQNCASEETQGIVEDGKRSSAFDGEAGEVANLRQPPLPDPINSGQQMEGSESFRLFKPPPGDQHNLNAAPMRVVLVLLVAVLGLLIGIGVIVSILVAVHLLAS